MAEGTLRTALPVRALGWAAGALLAVFLLRPVLGMVHVEGFTAALSTLGQFMAEGRAPERAIR